MLFRSIRVILPLILVILCSSVAWCQTDGWKMVHGDVLQVFTLEHKLLLAVGGEPQIYVVAEDCSILRQGTLTSLASLRPIAPDSFQDALCWVDGQGLISHILVNYFVQEEDGVLVAYDIFGNLK